jgi:hypothetical protein
MADPKGKSKRGKPRLTVALVEPLISRFLGNLAGIAAALDVSRQAVHNFVRGNPRLSSLVDAEKERVNDLVERSLLRAAIGTVDPATGQYTKEPEAWAVCFYLKTQGKDRGYVEKPQVEHSGLDSRPVVRGIVIEHHRLAAEEPESARGS